MNELKLDFAKLGFWDDGSIFPTKEKKSGRKERGRMKKRKGRERKKCNTMKW